MMQKSINKRAFLSASGAVFLAISTSQAMAHAELVSANPATNAIVSQPAELVLTFSESINLKFSGANLENSGGLKIPVGEVALAKDNDKILVIPFTAPLAPGEYLVKWHNLSKDGHKMKGSLHFTIKP